MMIIVVVVTVLKNNLVKIKEIIKLSMNRARVK